MKTIVIVEMAGRNESHCRHDQIDNSCECNCEFRLSKDLRNEKEKGYKGEEIGERSIGGKHEGEDEIEHHVEKEYNPAKRMKEGDKPVTIEGVGLTMGGIHGETILEDEF